MGNVLVKEETLTQIADAIREKSGSNDFYRPGEMPEAILDISTYSGEGADPNKPIRFYGPYGDLIYSYTFAEISALTELPALPEYKGLIGQEWNWSLENIIAENKELEVASLYITDDGSTRIYVTLNDEMLSTNIGFMQKEANTVCVDWGDGSALESSDTYGYLNLVSIGHTYKKEGNYVIRLIPNEDATFWLVGDTNCTYILHKVPRGSIENMVFANSITKVEIGRGMTSFTECCFCSYKLKYVTIPKEITDFARGFQKSYALEYIAFPRNLKNLTSSAIQDCISLKRVVFSDTDLSLSQYSFYKCESLRKVILSSKTRFHGGYVFSDCKLLEEIDLSQNGTEVPESPCNSCRSLRKVKFPETLWRIGANAFRSCEKLEEVEIPDTVHTIASNAFGYCYSLRKINIPEGITTISGSLFYNCYSLQKIVIPRTVEVIENYAFNKCYGIENYYLYPTNPPTLSKDPAFASTSFTIHVPKGCLEAYQTAEYWSEYADHMVEMEE